MNTKHRIAAPKRPISRRVVLAAAPRAAGLMLGVSLMPRGNRRFAHAMSEEGAAEAPLPSPPGGDQPFIPNAWVQIDRDGWVTVRVNKAEMGQGVLTGFATVVAEELDADWDRVRTEYAYGDPVYNSPLLGMHLTFGSTSLTESWEPLRFAGATARLMLIDAAARQWQVDPVSCRAERGEILHPGSGRRLSFGELAAAAATLPVPPPEAVRLKSPSDFRLIGRDVPRLDVPAKIDGSATYATDAHVPGMLTATILRCPVFGGGVRTHDPSAALAIAGVERVVELPAARPGETGGLAVVADGYWPAKLGRDALVVEWDEGPNGGQSSDTIRAAMHAQLEQPGVLAFETGDASAVIAASRRVIEAEYEAPFLAHATMEPMSCAAHARPDGLDIWVGHQSATVVRDFVGAPLTGLPPEAVTIHQTFQGCGLGRRGEADFVADAVALSLAMRAPVKVIWPREEDMRHDRYRPATVQRLRAALNETGAPVALTHQTVCDWQAVQMPGPTGEQIGVFSVGGLTTEILYAIPNRRVETTNAESGVPVGAWRSVGHSQNIFVIESFIDELAAAAGQDPVAYRRALLAGAPRMRAVLDLAAERAGWDQPLPPGEGRGVALADYGGTLVAEVVEVAVASDGTPDVRRIVCAVDCGIAVNPDIVEAQAVGGIIVGLTAALRGEITIADGRVEQGNFDDYPLLRFDEVPPIEVHIMPSDAGPTGIGEPTVPPVAPALANAIFAATGKRLRILPIRATDIGAAASG